MRRARAIAARQHMRSGTVAADEARLVDRGATTDTWESASAAPRTGQPAQSDRTLERDVVEEGIAAVEIPCDSAGRDVTRHTFGRVEVEAAPGVALARQRRHRIDAIQLVGLHCRALYVFVTPFRVFATVKLPSRPADTLIACAVVSSTLAMSSFEVLKSGPASTA